MKICTKKIFFAILLCPLGLVVAEQERSTIGSFMASGSSLRTVKKVKNGTQKTLSLKWQVYDPTKDKFYAQEPLIAPGSVVELDFLAGLRSLSTKKNKKKEVIKNKNEYEVSLLLGVATTVPSAPRSALRVRKLKPSESGVRVFKKEFLNHDELEFYKAQNGKILCRPVDL